MNEENEMHVSRMSSKISCRTSSNMKGPTAESLPGESLPGDELLNDSAM